MASTSTQLTTQDLELVMPEVDWGVDPLPDMGDRLVALQDRGDRCVPVRYRGDVAWLVLGYENVRHVFREEEEMPASTYFKDHMDLTGFSLFSMDGAEHKAWKTAVLGRFSPMAARRMIEPLLLPTADKLIDEIGDARKIDDFVQFYGRTYAFRIMSQLIGLTISPKDERQVMFWVSELSQLQDYHATPQELHDRALVAGKAINAMLAPIVKQRREERQDDLISWLIDCDVSGRTLSDQEVMDFTRMIYEGGAESSGFQLGNILNAILATPGMKDMLIANPETRTATIEELVRLEPHVGIITRKMIKDTMIAGTLVPAGKLALMAVPAALRSKDHFNNADGFSLEKRQNATLLFGAGVRACPGQHLARQLMRVSLDRILDRLPGLRLAGERKYPTGSAGRWIKDGLAIAFDDVLPAESVPPRELRAG